MVNRSELILWLIAFVVCLSYVLWGQRKSGSGAGLVISYALQLGFVHWVATSMYALPWYRMPDLQMLYGLQQSTYAIAGFGLGATILVPRLFRRRGPALEDGVTAENDPRMVHTYLLIGAVTYFVLEPMLHPIPTIGAIAAGAASLLLAALCIECWNAVRSGSAGGQSLVGWILLSALLPFITIITKGYLSYGFAAMLTVFSFVASFYRPRWKMVASSALVGFLALSMYVTYMRDRKDIRSVVWQQDAYSTRMRTILDTFSNFEFINPWNLDHLSRIDDRLNQNALVGLAVMNLEQAPENFARGRTIWDAILAPIPRVLWPDRPTAAGSGDLVSEFTGLRFDENTSVGIGNVMEWYVNFGSAGVFVGMLLMGVVIGWLDRHAIAELHAGELAKFVRYWLPGLGLLQVGGSLVEAVSSAATALVVALLVQRIGGSGRLRHPVTAPALAGHPRPAADFTTSV